MTLHPDARQFLDVIAVARPTDQIHAFFWLVNVMDSANRAVAEAGAAVRDALAAEARAR